MSATEQLVAWCASQGVSTVCVHGGSPGLAAALEDAGVVRRDHDCDAVFWLADSASVLPRPDLVAGASSRGWVVIEASLGAEGLVPVAVELDVVSVVLGGGEPRRIDMVDGAARARPLHLWSLPELDDHLAAERFQLAARAVDWYGDPFTADAPCHLSWFRNTPAEP